jgi:hypothetical protein
VKPIAAVFLSNCVNLVGVLWLGWDFGWILFLYGIESLVVGIFNLKKIQLADAKPKIPEISNTKAVINVSISMNLSVNGRTVNKWSSKEFMIFFVLLYGSLVFTLLFLLGFFIPIKTVFDWGILMWLISVLIQHGTDLKHFVELQRYKMFTKAQQTLVPFLRLLGLGVPVIVGIISQPGLNKTVFLLIMVTVKTGLDLLFVLKPSALILLKYGDQKEIISS